MKSIFKIGVSWKSREQKIIEIATQTWDFFYALFLYDNILFQEMTLSKERKKSILIKMTEGNREENISKIAETILIFSKSGIAKYEKEKNPTIEYSRPFGFSFVVSFMVNNKVVLSFIPKLGSDSGNGIGFVNQLFHHERSFNWYLDILKIMQNSTNATFGIMYSGGFKYDTNINYPLGFITYFSNDYDVQIPDNLEGFEYEYTSKGKYLIATREDFTVSKEAYQEQKEKLLRTMEYLGKTVPGYLRSDEK